jgi:hypothetical protein
VAPHPARAWRAGARQLDYTVYRSPDLGVTFAFPRDLFSLDTTDRKELKLYLRDSDGRPLIQISRTPLPENKDVKAGRDQEELKRLDYTLTYIAPEQEKNWSNWYVLSGVKLAPSSISGAGIPTTAWCRSSSSTPRSSRPSSRSWSRS